MIMGIIDRLDVRPWLLPVYFITYYYCIRLLLLLLLLISVSAVSEFNNVCLKFSFFFCANLPCQFF